MFVIEDIVVELSGLRPRSARRNPPEGGDEAFDHYVRCTTRAHMKRSSGYDALARHEAAHDSGSGPDPERLASASSDAAACADAPDGVPELFAGARVVSQTQMREVMPDEGPTPPPSKGSA